MDIVVTGGSGLLGTVLVPLLKNSPLFDSAHSPEPVEGEGHRVLAPSHGEMDVADPLGVEGYLTRHSPSLVIHSAGLTGVDLCEREPDLTHRVNAEGTANLARWCGQHGCRLIFISTDYVFDGSKPRPYVEEDRTHPVNVYGQSKLAGELAVEEFCPDHVILRTSWLFGPGRPDFVRFVLNSARAGTLCRAVRSHVGSPTYTADLARALERLVREPVRGIFHCANAGYTTWYDFALEILRAARVSGKVIWTTWEELNLPARRPKNSALSIEKWIRKIGHPMPSWKEAVGNYVKDGVDMPK